MLGDDDLRIVSEYGFKMLATAVYRIEYSRIVPKLKNLFVVFQKLKRQPAFAVFPDKIVLQIESRV